ncbi:MAG: hypothetical protein L6R41_001588 [Letrouitia leprolyta]|nr:MAG: hypothetical protein L6R41_001588 [Letrouitia leprolyta]
MTTPVDLDRVGAVMGGLDGLRQDLRRFFNDADENHSEISQNPAVMRFRERFEEMESVTDRIQSLQSNLRARVSPPEDQGIGLEHSAGNKTDEMFSILKRLDSKTDDMLELQRKFDKQTDRTVALEKELEEKTREASNLQKKFDESSHQVSMLQQKLRATGSERQGSAAEAATTLDVTRQLLKVCAEVAEIPASFLDDMVSIQTQSSRYKQHNGDSVEGHLPRMVFVPDAATLHPMVHAVKFWLAVRQDHSFFADSQALFNVRGIAAEMAPVYPWVLKALEYALGDMPSWEGRSLETGQKIFTVFQGIAYLNVLAQVSGIPLDGVRALRGTVQDYLKEGKLFGSESFIHTVFDQVASSIDGQALNSWINDQPSSEAEAVQRLDVGQRSFIADSAGQMFLLIDERNSDEVLYLFAEGEVDRIFISPERLLRLRFVDGLLADRLGQSIPFHKPGITAWIKKFMRPKTR